MRSALWKVRHCPNWRWLDDETQAAVINALKESDITTIEKLEAQISELRRANQILAEQAWDADTSWR